MAEHSQADRKSQLIAKLESARTGLTRNLRCVRHDISVGPHLKHAILRHKVTWLTGAAIAGWVVVSRLRAGKKSSEKKRAARLERSPAKRERAERTGIVLALLSILGTLLKPAATAFISRKIADMAEKNTYAPPAPQHRYAGR